MSKLSFQNTELLKVFGATISIFFSIAVLIPILPLYVHAVLLGNDVDVGCTMAMQAVGAISSRMIVGSIIGNRGTRAAIVIGSYICAVGGLVYFFSSNFIVLGLARLLQGIGEGFVFTSGTTWVLNIAPKDSRGRFVALFGLSLWLGSTFAPPLGGFITRHFGFNGAWVAATLAAIIGAFLIQWTKQEHRAAQEKVRLEWIPREAVRPGSTLALASAGFVAIATFGTLYFSRNGWPGSSFPIAAFGMGFVAMRFFGGKILDSWDLKTVAIFSTILEALGLLGLVFAPSPAIALVCCLMAGLGLALMYPAMAVVAVHGIDFHRQGTIIGWYTAFWDLSLLLSNVLFGWVAHILGYKAVFAGGCIGAILSLICILTWHNTIKHVSRSDKVV